MTRTIRDTPAKMVTTTTNTLIPTKVLEAAMVFRILTTAVETSSKSQGLTVVVTIPSMFPQEDTIIWETQGNGDYRTWEI